MVSTQRPAIVRPGQAHGPTVPRSAEAAGLKLTSRWPPGSTALALDGLEQLTARRVGSQARARKWARAGHGLGLSLIATAFYGSALDGSRATLRREPRPRKLTSRWLPATRGDRVLRIHQASRRAALENFYLHLGNCCDNVGGKIDRFHLKG